MTGIALSAEATRRAAGTARDARLASARVLDVDGPAWWEFVNRCPQALPYHHPAWARLIAECYGFRAFALASQDSGGDIAFGLPVIEVPRPLGIPGGRRWLSLPFTDFCPPLVAGGGALPPDAPAFLEAVRRETRLAAIEVRAPLDAPGAPGVSAGPVAVTHTLRLDPDPQAVYARFHKSQVQRNIAKAERGGLHVRRATNEEDVAGVFYRLHLRTRRRQGTPVQPRRFFRLLWQRVIQPGLGYALLAYSGETPVAAAVYLTWNGTTIYKYGASDEAHWGLRPNHLLFWAAIRAACEQGCHTFDFGRTDFDNAGLRAFKSGWGAAEEPLVYSRVGPPDRTLHGAEDSAEGEGAGGRGPGRLRRAVGAVIQRGPDWVCRALGEAFYRYAT